MTQIITAHSAYEEPNKTERRKRIQTPDIKGEIVDFKVQKKWLNVSR